MIRQTSLEAYQLVEPCKMYGAINGALEILGSATDQEIASYLQCRDPNAVRPRRNEMVKLAWVEMAGKRKCQISGRTAIVWRRRA